MNVINVTAASYERRCGVASGVSLQLPAALFAGNRRSRTRRQQARQTAPATSRNSPPKRTNISVAERRATRAHDAP
ncbi:hypothetical protein SB778_36330, partial [Paraburkholderia sp. SIMBA_050]